MKKHVMNKNVIHNGKHYPKGSELKADDKAFEQMVSDGHAHSMEFSDDGAAEQELPSQVEEQPQSKKHGRK